MEIHLCYLIFPFLRLCLNYLLRLDNLRKSILEVYLSSRFTHITVSRERLKRGPIPRNRAVVLGAFVPQRRGQRLSNIFVEELV